MADDVLESQISLDTHLAFQNLQGFMGLCDSAYTKLQHLGTGVDSLDTKLKSLGGSLGSVNQQTGGAVTAQNAFAQSTTNVNNSVTNTDKSVTNYDNSTKNLNRTVNNFDQSTQNVTRTTTNLDQSIKNVTNAQQTYNQTLDQSVTLNQRNDDSLRITNNSIINIRNTTRDAGEATNAMGLSAGRMIVAFAGLAGINQLLQAFERNAKAASEAIDSLSNKQLSRESNAQTVAINLGEYGPDALRKAELMIAGIQKRSGATPEQVAKVIDATQSAQFDIRSKTGGEVGDEIAKFSAKNVLSGSVIEQLAKIMKEQGVKDKDTAQSFMAKLEAGFRLAPVGTFQEFLDNMFKGVIQPGAVGGGSDFDTNFGQYIAATATTKNPRLAATAIQQMRQVVSGSNPTADKYLAHQAAISGLTTVADVTDADIESSVEGRESGASRRVQAKRKSAEDLEARATREQRTYDTSRGTMTATPLSPRSPSQVQAAKARLEKLDADHEANLEAIQRDREQIELTFGDATKEIAKKITQRREKEAYTRLPQDAKRKLLSGMVGTEEGRAIIQDMIGDRAGADNAMVLLQKKVQDRAAEVTGKIKDVDVDRYRDSTKAHLETGLAQKQISEADMTESAIAAQSPSNLLYSNIMERSTQRLEIMRANGYFTPGGGGGGDVIDAFKSEDHQKAQAAIEEFAATAKRQYDEISDNGKKNYPTLKDMLRIIEEFRSGRDLGKSFSSAVRLERLRKYIRDWSQELEAARSQDRMQENTEVRLLRGLRSRGVSAAMATQSMFGKNATAEQRDLVERTYRRADRSDKENETHTPIVHPDASKMPPAYQHDDDLGLPAVEGASAIGPRRAGKPKSLTINNVTIGTVVSRGGDALELPGSLADNPP